MNVTEQINEYLKALYDLDDPVYKSVYADRDGTPNPTINDPNDFNLGAVANVLEWNRQLGLCLVDQIFINKASTKYLREILEKNIGIIRYPGESDADYLARAQNFIIGRKVSKAAIIFSMRQYSSTEPVIQEGNFDVAYADVSYSDVYSSFQLVSPTTDWVLPALSANENETSFFFVLKLTDTDPNDFVKVIDTLNRLVAAGVAYEVQVTTTP